VELAYALPPPDRSFSNAIYGLKQFSIDLSSEQIQVGVDIHGASLRPRCLHHQSGARADLSRHQ